MAELKLNFPKKLDQEQLQQAEKVAKRAIAIGVDPALAVATAYQESRLRPNTPDSEKGAIGLMQVLPVTGKAYGYSEADLRDPEKNLDAGLKNLKEALAYTKNNPKLAAVYYHSGPDAIADLAADKPMGPKTKQYVKDLKSFGTFELFNSNIQAPAEAPELTAAEQEAEQSVKNLMAANRDPASVDYFGKNPASIPSSKVDVSEPTPEQLEQMKLEQEMIEARETAAEQKPFGAILGAGAGVAGAVAKDAIDARRGLGRVTQSLGQIAQQLSQQTPQTPPTAAPTSPPMPTQPQRGGLPSGTNPQATRILQGTTGDLGTTGRARQTGYNVETSQQAAAKAEAERIAQLLRQTGQVTQEAPQFFAQQPGMTSTPSGVLAPRSDLPRYLGPRGPQGEVGGVKPPVPVVPKMSGLDATKDLFVSMMRSASNVAPTFGDLRDMASTASRTLGRLPYISGPLAGLSIGMEVPELDYGMRVSQPDYTDLGLTGAGVLGTVGSFFPPVAPLAIPLSIGAPMIRDVRRRRQEIERNPAEYRDTLMKSLSDTDPMGNPMP